MLVSVSRRGGRVPLVFNANRYSAVNSDRAIRTRAIHDCRAAKLAYDSGDAKACGSLHHDSNALIGDFGLRREFESAANGGLCVGHGALHDFKVEFASAIVFTDGDSLTVGNRERRSLGGRDREKPECDEHASSLNNHL